MLTESHSFIIVLSERNAAWEVDLQTQSWKKDPVKVVMATVLFAFNSLRKR